MREIVERETFDTSFAGGKSVALQWGVVGVQTARLALISSLLWVMHFFICRSTSVSSAGQNPKRMWQLWLCYSSGAIQWWGLR